MKQLKTEEGKDSTTIMDSFTLLVDNLSLIKLQLSTLQQKIRQVEKKVKKELKNKKKLTNDKIVKQNKKPSGFAKPIKVTEELCEFMNRPIGTEIARTEVTKALITYIEDNNLKNQDKKQNIIPDIKLKKLLGITNEEIDQLNFFNIQKYMNKHFLSNKNKSQVINNGIK